MPNLFAENFFDLNPHKCEFLFLFVEAPTVFAAGKKWLFSLLRTEDGSQNPLFLSCIFVPS